ncbi:hypothetical protein MUO83_02585 [Candidatus Bathyarchaeota archaeon]|nr:hypothetical protein [Candidatus Bathyarchaeota archaeon]
MSETNYRIKYKKGDFEVEVQGDKVWVEAKLKELAESEAIPKPIAISPETKPSSLPVSLAEFVKSKGSPDQHVALVVIFGYWLIHKENLKSFNSKDIKKCYDDTRIPESTNTPQYLNKTQGSGYFKRLDEQKDGHPAWIITPSGDDYVEKEQWKTAK